MDEQEKNRIYIRKTKNSFTREQRAGFVLVIGVGSIAMLLGLVYVGRHLASPFDINYSGPIFLSSEEQQALELIEQQSKDTDSDTISDYDELYVYKTSPYLQDTDGDSYTDANEITAGTDPTCATGADCDQVDFDVTNTIDLNVDVSADDTTIRAEQALAEIQTTIANMSVEEIRQLLITSGVSEEQINAMTDDEIQALFDSVISDLTSSGQIDAVVEESLQ